MQKNCTFSLFHLPDNEVHLYLSDNKSLTYWFTSLTVGNSTLCSSHNVSTIVSHIVRLILKVKICSPC